MPVLDWLKGDGARLLGIVLFALLLDRLAVLAVRRMRKRLEGAPSVTQQYSLQRATTLTQTLSSVLRAVIWTMALLLALGQLGINLGPLIAGAGVAGVALGFGAQSLVRDFLSGFFILLEDQFGVGQFIELRTAGGNLSGNVESMSLRVTAVRDFDGTLHVVPNGNILGVGNKSRGWARAIVDVQVDQDEDVERVRRVLDELLDEIAGDPKLERAFFSRPSLLGVETFGDYRVVFRVTAQTWPHRRWDVEREMRRRIKQRFDERGIRMPSPVPAIPGRGDGPLKR
jgi:small conductance mechanosensitive channel